FAGQIQGRTYANIFGLVERFITAKLLEIGKDHWLGDQMALEALVRFSDEELKHQALFRRIEKMMAETMPEGYRFDVDPDMVARAVLSKSTFSCRTTIGKVSHPMPNCPNFSRTCSFSIGRTNASMWFWTNWNSRATTPRSPTISGTVLLTISLPL